MNENDFKLSEEDYIRMKRLSQEVMGKLTEMSMIVASTTKATPKALSEVILKLPEKTGDSIQVLFKSPKESTQGEILSWPCYRDPPGRCGYCSQA